MNTSLIGSETVKLVSQITGQKLRDRDLTPPVVFISALVMVMQGVMFADDIVTANELEKLQTSLNWFAPPGSNLYQLVQTINRGIQNQKLYDQIDPLLILTAPMSDAEKLLLISFGYQILAADGEIDVRINSTEKKYLKNIARGMSVKSQHVEVLEFAFSKNAIANTKALDEVYFLLDPSRFQSLSSLFVDAASRIIQCLPAKPNNQADRTVTQSTQSSYYQDLKNFQEYKNELENLCYRLFQIIQNCDAALEVILGKTDNEYLQSFQNLVQYLEKFLRTERGERNISQAAQNIQRLIKDSLDGLDRAEATIDGKINLSEAAKQEILEKIGEASGCDIRIRNLADDLKNKAIEEASVSWGEWYQGLKERMNAKAQNWHSQYSHIFNQNELIQDYANQFVRDLQTEIDEWGHTQLRDIVLQENLKFLDQKIRQEIKALQHTFKFLNREIDAKFSQQLNFEISGINDGIADASGFMGGIETGGAFALELAFTGTGMVKTKMIEQGLKKLEESKDKIKKRLGEIVFAAIGSRVEASEEKIEQIILYCENALELQEKTHQQNLAQRQNEKVFMAQKRQEIEQVQKGIEAVLSQVGG